MWTYSISIISCNAVYWLLYIIGSFAAMDVCCPWRESPSTSSQCIHSYWFICQRFQGQGIAVCNLFFHAICWCSLLSMRMINISIGTGLIPHFVEDFILFETMVQAWYKVFHPQGLCQNRFSLPICWKLPWIGSPYWHLY